MGGGDKPSDFNGIGRGAPHQSHIAFLQQTGNQKDSKGSASTVMPKCWLQAALSHMLHWV